VLSESYQGCWIRTADPLALKHTLRKKGDLSMIARFCKLVDFSPHLI
jgi:hypothetical protein